MTATTRDARKITVNRVKRVLLVCYGGGHVAMVEPVARKLFQEGFSVQILALTTAEQVVRDAGLPCVSMRNFLRPQDGEAERWGRRLVGSDNQNSVVPYEESVAYLGLSYADLVAEVGEEDAARRYEKYGRQTFLPVQLLRRILAEIKPDVLVATSSPRAERAAIIAAGLEGIPSVCMVDLFATYEIEWLKDPDYAQRVCVLNEVVKRKLTDAGRTDGQVCVTGNPAFDSLIAPETLKRGIQLRNDRGWQGQAVVLWASQIEPLHHPSHPGETGSVELPMLIQNQLRRVCANHQDLSLVIRYHPNQPWDTQELQPLGANERVSGKEEELASLLHAVDVVVVITSTVGLQAHMVGATVVQVTGTLSSSDLPYKALGVADFESTLDELPGVLLQAVALAKIRRVNKDRRQLENKLELNESESAASKVVNVIKSVLTGPEENSHI